ncbi:unnamed protein product [Arctogadus glacialis]
MLSESMSSASYFGNSPDRHRTVVGAISGTRSEIRRCARAPSGARLASSVGHSSRSLSARNTSQIALNTNHVALPTAIPLHSLTDWERRVM